MIDVCFGCGKEMEWMVDDYTFRWTMTSPTSYRVQPFCHQCADTKVIKNWAEENREPEQLTLDI